MQSEVARKVAGSLELRLLPAEQAQVAGAQPVNPEAYEAYLRGLQLSYAVTPQELNAALEYFDLALKKDPAYAPAYTGIAMVWLYRQQMGYATPLDAGPRAKAATLKALELDGTSAQAHAALAAVNWLYEWDRAGADAEYRKAIELNPNYPDARALYSNYLACMRRPAESLAQGKRTLELDPFNALFRLWIGANILLVGRHDDGIAALREALRMAPDLPFAHWMLTDAFFAKGMYEESLAEIRTYYAADREVDEALRQGYAKLGYKGAMRRAGDILAARARRTYQLPCDIAGLYVWAGEQAEALTWLEKGLEVRDPNLPFVRLYPSAPTLRDAPRFKAILRRMNLPE